ncbi:hypothetical protein Tco_0826893 [Tanacetum coccineum]
MASEQFSSGPGLHSMTHASSSGLEAVALRATVLAVSPMSTSIDQDASSTTCALEKARNPHSIPKAKDTNQEKLYLFAYGFCGPMRVASINGKRTNCGFIQDLLHPVTGLVSNPVSQRPCIPPKRDDWDHLFQPMFDEYFNPPSIVVTPIQEAAAPKAVVLTDSLVSTSIDQDVPSTQKQELSPNISQGFRESPKTPTFRDDPLIISS